jgi:hypothetical protein
MGETNKSLLDFAFKDLNIYINHLLEVNKWEGTNREVFMKMVPKNRGVIAEKLIKSMCKKLKIDCELQSDNRSGFDAFIGKNKIRVEIKYAAEANNGNYTFNQIRPEENKYQFIIFFFLSPENSKFYTIKKSELKFLTLSRQHSGGKTYTMSNTKKNMLFLSKTGTGSFVEAINKIR